MQIYYIDSIHRVGMSFENGLIDNCTIFTTDNFATFQFDTYCVFKDLNKK